MKHCGSHVISGSKAIFFTDFGIFLLCQLGNKKLSKLCYWAWGSKLSKGATGTSSRAITIQAPAAALRCQFIKLVSWWNETLKDTGSRNGNDWSLYVDWYLMFGMSKKYCFFGNMHQESWKVSMKKSLARVRPCNCDGCFWGHGAAMPCPRLPGGACQWILVCTCLHMHQISTFPIPYLLLTKPVLYDFEHSLQTYKSSDISCKTPLSDLKRMFVCMVCVHVNMICISKCVCVCEQPCVCGHGNKY